MTVFTRAQGELDFLLRDPAGIRIARFTTTGLRFADAAGHELSAASFPLSLDMTEPSPIQTPYGFRFLCREQEKMTLESGLREKPVSYTNFGWLVDEEGRKKTRLEGPKGSTCSGMRVSPDGSRVAVRWAFSKAHQVIVHRTGSGQQDASLPPISQTIWSWVFSPDGTRIATATEEGVTGLWDASTGTLKVECRGHKSKVLSVAFRPDGLRLVTTSADGTVRQWDSTTGREVERLMCDIRGKS